MDANMNYEKAGTIDLSDKGRYIFASQCAACHTIGHGDKIGPDLLGVTKVRDAVWLQRFIATPDRVLAEKDPLALALFKKYKGVRMPNLNMADVDLKRLIKFLESQSEAPAKEAPAAEKPGQGDTGEKGMAPTKTDSAQPMR
jgi:protein SCO1/2